VPTAVVQIDVEADTVDIPVPPRYDRAYVLVRRRGSPVAQFYAPVRDGRLDAQATRRGLDSVLARHRWRWKVDDYIGEPPPFPVPAATVAVCTRERPDDLTRALHAIGALDPAPHQVLVVDNNPATDRTREVVASFPGVRYLREDTPGLDAARNRALRDAITPVVAFTDDDAAPEPAWLQHLLQPFEDPRVLCTTGLTLPLELETEAQEWFERLSPFGRGFERRAFDGTRHDPVAVAQAGAGANMALRRSVLDEAGPFDEALDAGTATRSGGDHEMFGRILAAGYRIVYEPRAVSWHRHRRTWPELREAIHGYGVGVYAMWTRRLVVDHELGVLRHAYRWMRRVQLPLLWRSLSGAPDSPPLELLRAELRGCLAGPAAYFSARRRVRARRDPR
jgi:cellulose synthase/poly-beta-1,6-N-acetylglucosamine synthase-like glycosyltransferase